MANHIIPRFVTVSVLTFVLMTAFLQMASVRADSEHGTGYVGCYPVGTHWQGLLDDDDSTEETVDDCAYHCSGYTYSAISIRQCFCGNALPMIKMANEKHCNITCSRNPCQICGASKYYSVYNTSEILNRVQVTAGLSCCKFDDSSKHVYAECVDRTNRTMEADDAPKTMSTCFPTTEIVYNTSEMLSRKQVTAGLSCCKFKDSSEHVYAECVDRTNRTNESDEAPTTISANFPTTESEEQKNCNEEEVKELCRPLYSLWLRIVIDVVVILAVLFLIILGIIVVRFWRKRPKGMFDKWQPRSIHQRSGNEPSVQRTGGDLMNRNHSYRNLSGSSTLDRGLESIDQAYASITAQGPAATVCPFDGENGNHYGSLPDSAKGAMASETCPTNTPPNIHKCNSSEGGNSDPDLCMVFDQTGNRHTRSDLKSKPTHAVKPRQEGHSEDSKVEKYAPDKSKRISFFDHLPRLPSSRKPSKCEGTSTECPVPTIDMTSSSLCRTKDKAKTNVIEFLDRSIASTAEKFLEDPRSNTMPHDIYALPDKSSNGPSKKKSCTMQGGGSVDIEPQTSQEGYGGFDRLFKSRTRGKSEQRQGEDPSSPEEYSVLKPELKTSGYDKLAHGKDTDGAAATDPTYNIVGDDPGSAFETGEVLYASMDDDWYAVVGEGTAVANQNGDYEMVAHGQIE